MFNSIQNLIWKHVGYRLENVRIKKICNNKLYKFSWLGNLNYVVSFQFLVIEETQKGNRCKVRNVILSKGASWFIVLKCYLEIRTHICMKIHGSVLWKWFMVWLHCKKDMELSHMIFRELIGGKYLCDVTGHYLLLYCLCGIVGPWVKGENP